MPESTMTIGQLARAAGTTTRTVRFFHGGGLLPEVERDAAGYRRYNDSDLQILREILRLRAAGTSIAEIRTSLATHREWAAMLATDAHRVEETITRLEAIRSVITDAALVGDGLAETRTCPLTDDGAGTHRSDPCQGGGLEAPGPTPARYAPT